MPCCRTRSEGERREDDGGKVTVDDDDDDDDGSEGEKEVFVVGTVEPPESDALRSLSLSLSLSLSPSLSLCRWSRRARSGAPLVLAELPSRRLSRN